MLRTKNARVIFAFVVAIIVIFHIFVLLLRFASDLHTWSGAYIAVLQAYGIAFAVGAIMLTLIVVCKLVGRWIDKGEDERDS